MNLIKYLNNLLQKGHITKRELVDTLTIYFDKDDIKKPLFDTKIIIKALDKGKLTAPVLSSANACVFNGRLDLQELVFGSTPNTNQHLFLNQIESIQHSVNTYNNGENSLLYRNRVVNYFCIGNGAESTTITNDIISERASDTKLYKMVPFRCVTAGNDLSDVEAENYRLKKTINIKGQNYIAYYAKKFTFSNVKVMYNGNNYVPVESDTSVLPDTDPTKPLRAGNVLIFTTIDINVSEKDFKEYYKAMNNGSLDMAKISEVGLISGYDTPSTYNGNKNELANASLFAKICFSGIPFSTESSECTLSYNIYS